MFKAAIVEDSRLARLELKKLLEDHSSIEVVAEYVDPVEAISELEKIKPELLFLDIQMPGKNGFELLDLLSFQPKVIFTTAYDHYAVRSFEYDAVDYLLKPIEQKRLESAVNKLSHTEQVTEAAPLDVNSSVFIKDGDNCHFVELTTIECFESCGNYCKVHFKGAKPMLHKSLNQLEKRLPPALFFRANRQQIINLKFIKGVEPWFNGGLQIELQNGEQIEVSRRHTSRFKAMLSL